MQIIQRTFLIFYLPISLFIFWKLLKSPKAKRWMLLSLSLAFYSLAGWKFLILLIGLSLATFYMAQRGWWKVGIILNLSTLIVFKYWDFGITQLTRISTYFGEPILLPLFYLALPLGLSYYIFKHVGYLLDVQKGRYAPTGDLLSFLTFSTLLFQISAGPISSFQDTGEQLRNLPKRLSPENAYAGLLHLSTGLAKKILLADALLPIFDFPFYQSNSSGYGFWTMWMYAFLRGIHIYLDFSGYTDIVLGLSYWFGLTLPPNFDNPYFATNPSEFWERWHISLSQWFRVYLFAPLSRGLLKTWGRKRRDITQYTANFITMSLVGLWHGARWSFILWGLYHGLLLNLNARITGLKPNWRKSGFYRIATLLAVMLGWIIFFSPGFGTLRNSIATLLGFNGLGTIAPFFSQLSPTLYLPILISVIVTFSGFAEADNIRKYESQPIAILAGVLLALLLTLSGTPSDFTYALF
jgi:alginate O-acetyltransferase complex protein AlgI